MSIVRSRRALLLGGFVIAALSTGTAFAGKQTAVQSIEAVPYTVPAGDNIGGAAHEGSGAAEIRTRVPIGEEALQRLKHQASAPESGVASVPVQEAEAPAGEAAGSTKAKFLRGSCKTNSANGFAPSDIHGAAGNANLVVVTNSDIGIYKKSSCALLASTTLKDFFSAVGVDATATLFDPRVVYDRVNGRFFVTAESSDSGNNNQYQYIAVSQTGTGRTYYLYKLTLSEGGATFCKRRAANFWDYPNVGFSRARWFITANDFDRKNRSQGAILSLDKAASLNGKPVKVKCFNKLPSNLAPPIVLDKASFGIFLSPGSGEGTALRRIRITQSKQGPQKDTRLTLSDVTIPAWTAAPDAPQPNGQLLDTLDGRFQSASIQGSSKIWNVHTVSYANTAKIRVYKMTTKNADTKVSIVFQPTTVRPPSMDFLFNASLASRSAKDGSPLFLTVSRTVPDVSKGRAAHLMFQGHNNSQDIADWRFVTVATSRKQMTGCNTKPEGSCRWGDYSSTQIDPRLGTSSRPLAWGFNQLVGGSGTIDEFDWQTRAGLVGTVVP